MVDEEFREFRKTVIGAIMATDMAHHGEFVRVFSDISCVDLLVDPFAQSLFSSLHDVA